MLASRLRCGAFSATADAARAGCSQLSALEDGRADAQDSPHRPYVGHCPSIGVATEARPGMTPDAPRTDETGKNKEGQA